jgi:hypothetical protein
LSETVSGEGVWKNISMLLAGLLINGAGWLIYAMHDSITRTEVDQKIHEAVSGWNEQVRAVNDHLAHIDQTQVETGREVARIGEHLGVSRPVAPH